uniref:Uncharacterized protein n=1 Tax=Dictyoglomus turgidum TaxID=513050 RepID=A0A7C3WP17_9BACT
MFERFRDRINFFTIKKEYKAGDWFCAAGKVEDSEKWESFMKYALYNYPENFRFAKSFVAVNGIIGGVWVFACDNLGILDKILDDLGKDSWIVTYKQTKEGIPLVGDPIYPLDPKIILSGRIGSGF